jgi:hypothetical protein
MKQLIKALLLFPFLSFIICSCTTISPLDKAIKQGDIKAVENILSDENDISRWVEGKNDDGEARAGVKTSALSERGIYTCSYSLSSS